MPNQYVVLGYRHLKCGSYAFEMNLSDDRVATPVKQTWNVQIMADVEAPIVQVDLPRSYGDSDNYFPSPPQPKTTCG